MMRSCVWTKCVLVFCLPLVLVPQALFGADPPPESVTLGPNVISMSSLTYSTCLSQTASLIALKTSDVSIAGNALIRGDMHLFSNAIMTLSGSALSFIGTVHTPLVSNIIVEGDPVLPNIVIQDLSANEPAILQFAQRINGFTPQHKRATINKSLDLRGSGNLNVIEVTGHVELSGRSVLRIIGGSNDVFFFIVRGNVEISGRAMIELVGVTSKKVIFYLSSATGNLDLSGRGQIHGTYFAPNGGGSTSLSGDAQFFGTVVAKDAILISGSGLSVSPAPFCPITPAEDGGEGPPEILP